MNFAENEHKILKFWEEKRIFKQLKEKNRGKKRWSFLDGPITANNPMGVHHGWGRTYKDMFQRYKAMRGFDQRFQNGFDCQGLWVEVEVEKELGFKNKKDIENYGIERFIEKCKERVHKYSIIQTEQSIRLGQFADWGEWKSDLNDKDWLKKSHSYYTMSDKNNYAIWNFLKKCKEKGLLYKGKDVVPWCPRCGTAISQHEILAEEYKEIIHKAVFFKVKANRGLSSVGGGNLFFLVWTTTPWTLPGNVALAVHPDFDYAKIKDIEGNVLIVLKERAGLIEGGKIVEEIKGRELKGLRYEGLFDELPAVKQALGGYRHKVILWKEVTREEGTAIVHSAPGCGQEDFRLSKEFGLPVIDLSDDESNYREGFGGLSGKFVGSQEARDWIFENLKEKGLLFKIEDYSHRYPICWRCKTELIFRLVDEWYISMEKLRKPLMESAKKIKWIPDFCLERELDWLRNMQDWLISKKRYWGLALPIWECKKCGNFEVIGSKEELRKKFFAFVRNSVCSRSGASSKEIISNEVEDWDEFEGHSPHRPWVDKIKINCSKCGEIVSRIPDVGTPWLDAGIVPFSTLGDDNRSENTPYFHNKKEWRKWFPADFVCESFPGQFKNWFYVLLVMSQVLEDRPPFKTLLGYATVVDEKGEEMHKSKGNAIWFNDAVEKIGADVMRWMYVKQNPAYNMRFGYNIAKETHRKLLILWNSYRFFETYKDDQNPKTFTRLLALKCLAGRQDSTQLKVQNLLDKWIISRLNRLILEVTESLDRFDAMRASLLIENFFIEDLSLWYVRRSRKRFQNPPNKKEKEEALAVLHYLLLTLTKLIAPMMPFLAEEFYQGLKTEDMSESVHLCEWPEYNKAMVDENLEDQMAEARRIVALVLAKRAELGIGVRQPLSKLKIKTPKLKISEGLLDLIKEEVNVKEVVFDETIQEEIILNATITDELKEEGQLREIIRHIQDLRKKAGLTPKDKVVICYSADKRLGDLIAKNEKQILVQTKSKELKPAQIFSEVKFEASKEVKIDGKPIWLAVEKIEKV